MLVAKRARLKKLDRIVHSQAPALCLGMERAPSSYLHKLRDIPRPLAVVRIAERLARKAPMGAPLAPVPKVVFNLRIYVSFTLLSSNHNIVVLKPSYAAAYAAAVPFLSLGPTISL